MRVTLSPSVSRLLSAISSTFPDGLPFPQRSLRSLRVEGLKS